MSRFNLDIKNLIEYHLYMSRNFNFEIKEYYHCYGRGTDKRKVFLSKKDYQRFIALLFVCNSVDTIHLSDHSEKSFDDLFLLERENTLVDIGAYCLMPNHFHLLLREKSENGISLFMQKLITAYTMYFNKKNERSGALFESRFKARHVNIDKYLKYLFSYIHLNPVKLINPEWRKDGIKNINETKKFLEKYDYSSYLDYLKSDRPQYKTLNLNGFPDYFGERKIFEHELWDWLNYNDE